MNRVLVDIKTFEYCRFIAVEPRMKFENEQRTEEQARNNDGVPLWTVTVLAKEQGASKPSTITVKIAMDKIPTVQEFAPIGFVNLSAYAYTLNNRASLAFSADKFGEVREK